MNKIVMFCGKECPDCIAEQSTVDRLISEGIQIEQLEVWHNQDNLEEMEKHEKVIRKAGNGNLPTPTFFDEKTNRAICGQVPYEELKKWINNK